jgi:low temperature requirement protein LtrA
LNGTTNERAADSAPGTQRSADRPVIEPPRLRLREDTERQTNWLEFFFDLVFIAAVGELAQRLAGPITTRIVVGYVVLAVPLWWSWVGYVYYSDRFGTDDLSDRVITVVQMAAAIAIAVTVRDALEQSASSFALAYALFRFILVARYALAAWFVPHARKLALRYAIGFGAAALLWAVSALFPRPALFWIWGLALLVDFGTPLTMGRLHAEFTPDSKHLQERFGTFVLIVMGQGAMATVTGLREAPRSFDAWTIAVLALVLGFAFWWAYFETIDGAPIDEAERHGRVGVYQGWIYVHLPLGAAIAAYGMAIQHAILEAGDGVPTAGTRWLWTGAVAAVFLTLAAVSFVYMLARHDAGARRQVIRRLLAALAALGIGAFGTRLSAPGIAIALAVVGVVEIALDIGQRRREREPWLSESLLA